MRRPTTCSSRLVAARGARCSVPVGVAPQPRADASSRRPHDAEASLGQVASRVGVDLGADSRGRRRDGPDASDRSAADAGSCPSTRRAPSRVVPVPTAHGRLGRRAEPDDRGAPSIGRATRATRSLEPARRPRGRPSHAHRRGGLRARRAREPPGHDVDRRARLVGWVVEQSTCGAVLATHRPEGRRRDGPRRTRSRRPTARARRQTTPSRSSTSATGGSLVRAGVDRRRGRRQLRRSRWPWRRSCWRCGRWRAVLLVLAGASAQPMRLAEARAAQVRLIGEVAPLVQQSLELAEVLPSVGGAALRPLRAGRRGAVPGRAARARPSCSAWASTRTRRSEPVLQPPDHLARRRDPAPGAAARRPQRRAAPGGGRPRPRCVGARVAAGARRARHRRAGERAALRQPAGGARSAARARRA